MAEPDAAGPRAPGRPNSRDLSRADLDRLLAEADREWDSLSPEERARRKAESEKADREAFEAVRPFFEALETAQSAARPAMEAIERAGGALSAAFGGPLLEPAHPPLGIVEDPRERIQRVAAIVAAIEPAQPLRAEDVRQAVAEGMKDALAKAARDGAPDSGSPATAPLPGMFTGGAAWQTGQTAMMLGRFMRQMDGLPPDPSSKETALVGQAQPLASVDEIKAAAAAGAREGTKEALAESKKDPQPRGKTTCERLEDLHVRVDPAFAETATLRELSERIKRSTGAIDGSHYYQTKLKPRRAEIRVRKADAKRAQKWGDFNSVGRRDEDSKGH